MPRSRRFDAISRLEHYDNIAPTIAEIEQRLRQEMDNVLGADWRARWPKACRIT